MKLRPKERDTERLIRDMLELHGWRTHKLEVFAGAAVDYEGRTRRYTEGVRGQPDLIAVKPGWVLYVETKSPTGRVAKHQQAVHEVLRKDGFPVIVARSWEQLAEEAKRIGINLEER